MPNKCRKDMVVCNECEKDGKPTLWYWDNRCNHPDGKLMYVSTANLMTKPQEGH